MRRVVVIMVLAQVASTMFAVRIKADLETSGRLPLEGECFMAIHSGEDCGHPRSWDRLSESRRVLIISVEGVLAEWRLDYRSRMASPGDTDLKVLWHDLPIDQRRTLQRSTNQPGVTIAISGEYSIRYTGLDYLAKVELIALDIFADNKILKSNGVAEHQERIHALRDATVIAANQLLEQLQLHWSDGCLSSRTRVLITLPHNIADIERVRLEQGILNACRKIASHVEPEILTEYSLQLILYQDNQHHVRDGAIAVWSALKQEMHFLEPDYSCHRRVLLDRLVWIEIRQNAGDDFIEEDEWNKQ